MPKCFRSCPECRVSSAATTSHSASTRNARNVMSSRFPMGVATRYSVPGVSGGNGVCLISVNRHSVPQPRSKFKRARWIGRESASEAILCISDFSIGSWSSKICYWSSKGMGLAVHFWFQLTGRIYSFFCSFGPPNGHVRLTEQISISRGIGSKSGRSAVSSRRSTVRR